MAHELRIKIAALVTVGFLAVMSAAGLGLRHDTKVTHVASAQTQTQAQVSSGEHESEED